MAHSQALAAVRSQAEALAAKADRHGQAQAEAVQIAGRLQHAASLGAHLCAYPSRARPCADYGLQPTPDLELRFAGDLVVLGSVAATVRSGGNLDLSGA